jgi:2-polyprenyl-3-methyl-5-hydroxy-6-metoxy-1,4-benzoquinol methylase
VELSFLPEDAPFPFTVDWYRERHHAPHLEQGAHHARLYMAAGYAFDFTNKKNMTSVVDLGCGDGGLLYLISELLRAVTEEDDVELWGYDLMPANVEHGRWGRGMDVRYCDFEHDPIEWADVCVITECLEHLRDPHAMVRRIFENAKAVVASSPSRENAESHDECHIWAWDMEGYREMFEKAGFTVLQHEIADPDGYGFQVLKATVL